MSWRTTRAIRRCDPDAAPKRTFATVTRLAKVAHVYDGDTITIATKLHSGEPVCRYALRVAGIDTPEVRHADDVHRAAGRAVRDFIRDTLLPVGCVVWVTFQKEDKYGRLLGTVTRVGPRRWLGRRRTTTDLGATLVRRGMAVAYDGGTKPVWTQAMLLEAIRAARA